MKTLKERFMAKVSKDKSGCWLWTGCVRREGYGRIMVESYVVDYAHRASWMLHRGEVPAGMNVCHTCDVRKCVNPDHLFLGSQKDNIDDMVRKGRIGNRAKTADHRAKLSAALKGRKLSAQHRANIKAGWARRSEALRT